MVSQLNDARVWIVQVDQGGKWKQQLRFFDCGRAVSFARAIVAMGIARTATVGYYRKASFVRFLPPRFVGLVSFTRSYVDMTEGATLEGVEL
jgi:hypothetical protein